MSEIIQVAKIGDRLKDALYIRRMKSVELSRITGINTGSICHYIKNDYEPKTENIYLMAKALNISEAWLLGMDVPMDRILDKNNSAEDARSSLYALVDSLSMEECELAARLIKSVIKGD